jgi:nucleotide-binding universal stress UspA family protein
MYRSIVVGTDGSSTATAAVRHAAELAKLTGATLHVVCAYSSAQAASAMAMTSGAMAGVAVDTGLMDDDLVAGANSVLDEALVGDVAAGIEVVRHTQPGAASDVLVDVAEQEKADVIVVGNRGMTGARRFLLGSVPNRVAHSASCHVLIVHTT